MKVKLLCLAFCLIKSMTVCADNVIIGDLVYQLNGTEAYVTGYVGTPTDVTIPATIESDGLTFKVTKVNEHAFKHKYTSETKYSETHCSSMTSLRAEGNNLIEIKSQAFEYCGSLASVSIPSVKYIRAASFRSCDNLQNVLLGNNLKSIDGDNNSAVFFYACGAFLGCSKLSYIVIPASCTSLGENVFYGCSRLQAIIYLGDQTSKCGSNASIYNVNNMVKWNENTFIYTGSAPVPTFTNNLPAGFQPTGEATLPTLEKDAGNYNTTIPISFTNNDMSFTVNIPYSYTINPLTVTARVENTSKVYGDPNPQFHTDYTGFITGEDKSVITNHGSYSTSATTKSDVGTYNVTQSGAKAKNYTFQYESGILTVNKAPLTMTANDKSMTYGGVVPALDFKYEGLKNNETQPVWNSVPQLSTTAMSSSKAGAYPITISNADAKNYEVTVNNGTMTIEKANLTVRANSVSRQYGEANPQFALSYTGLKNNETVPEWERQPKIETTATLQSPVGTYPIIVNDAVAVNYNLNTVEGTLTVNKAALQITPKNAARKYGEDNPTFELSYVGLKNNESEPEWTTAPVITTQATKTSSVGDYSIHVSTAEARNYTLTKKTGTLTITKAPLNVGINNCTRKYGESNPQFGLYYSGLRNNETTPEWIQQPTISTTATQKSDVGEYAITATGGVMRNYETSGITAGTLTITPALLTIKANNASRLYFEDNPQFTYSCTGFVGNDNTSALTVKPQITTNANKNSNVGVYAIEIGNAQSKNYTLSYQKGQLNVNKRQLTVSTNNYTREYGQENPTFELSYVGFVNNENENVLISKPKATTNATLYSDVGVYDITIDNGIAENYDFSYYTGKLTIEKAYQTLTWNQVFSDLKQYDQIELTATASSGLDVTYTVEGNQVCSISRIGKKQYLDCTGEGEAVIVAIQEGNKNYWQTSKMSKSVVIESSSVTVTYTLSISSGSGGMVSYLGNSVNGTTKTYTVNEGAYPVLYFVPDAGYRIKSVVENGMDVTASVADNQYTVSNVSQNTTVSVVYELIPEKFPVAEAVDLGLSVDWASWNMGESTPSGNTHLYGWGDVTGELSSTIRGHYAVGLPESYNVSIAGNENYDIAAKQWGEGWRMPTKADFDELYSSCDITSTTVNGVNGYRFTSKANPGKSIFMPVSGARYGTTVHDSSIPYYWTANGVSEDYELKGVNALLLSSSAEEQHYPKFWGMAIRPVKANSSHHTGGNTGEQSGEVGIAVNLGLPSGTKWASHNLGAATATDCGGYYAWGDLEPRTDNFGRDDYQYYDVSTNTYAKFANGYICGNASYDAATAAWGSSWQMPSRAQVDELLTSCTWTWKTNHQNSGMSGYEVKGPNNNTIFLPAGGMYAVLTNYTELYQQGTRGRYWTGNVHNTTNDTSWQYVYLLDFGQTSKFRNYIDRYVGCNIRPVLSDSNAPVSNYTFSITSSEGGTVTYLDNTIIETTKSYSVEEGSSCTLTFAPNVGYWLKSVVVNGTDVTASVVNNLYTISNIGQNTTVNVEYAANKYKLTYRIDGVEYKTTELEYNKAITPEPAPSKEGYTFLGWSTIPATMPANDVTVTGSFSVNKYKLTYKIDENLYKEVSYDYGATIVPEAIPQGDYASFEWVGVPTTMPARDVVVTANYTTSPVTNFTYNGIKYTIVSQTEQTVEVAASNESAGVDGPVLYYGDIVIPSTVSYGGKTYTVIGIGESAFINSDITSVSLPNTLTYIGKEAFVVCLDLHSITIPQSVTTYGYNPFGVTLISEMTVLNSVPVEVPYNAFIYLQDYNNCVLYVPYGSANAYRNAKEWSKFKTIVEMDKEPDLLDGHEYVDLGLPSGKCWAATNYGATSPDGYGSYLEWSDRNLISSDWGSGWTTPSLQDIRELENNCTWTWGQKNGHNGYTVKGKNGNSIFLPASGFMMLGQSSAKKVGDWAYYWTSTPSDGMANIIMSSSSSVWYGEMETSYTKLPIRPITKEKLANDIEDMRITESENLMPIYDMRGRRVTTPRKGQMYIQNGIKFIAK